MHCFLKRTAFQTSRDICLWMFHASSNSNKKILAKHSENPLEMFFMRFQFTSFHGIPYISADAVCHFSRINCTRSQQIRWRWTLNNVFETCATRLGSIVRDANCYPHKLEVLCAKLHYSHSLCVLPTLLRLIDWLTDWLTYCFRCEREIFMFVLHSRDFFRRRFRNSELKLWISEFLWVYFQFSKV